MKPQQSKRKRTITKNNLQVKFYKKKAIKGTMQGYCKCGASKKTDTYKNSIFCIHCDKPKKQRSFTCNRCGTEYIPLIGTIEGCCTMSVHHRTSAICGGELIEAPTKTKSS